MGTFSLGGPFGRNGKVFTRWSVWNHLMFFSLMWKSMCVWARSYFYFDPMSKDLSQSRMRGVWHYSLNWKLILSFFLPTPSFHWERPFSFLWRASHRVLLPLSSLILNHRLFTLILKIAIAPSHQFFHMGYGFSIRQPEFEDHRYTKLGKRTELLRMDINIYITSIKHKPQMWCKWLTTPEVMGWMSSDKILWLPRAPVPSHGWGVKHLQGNTHPRSLLDRASTTHTSP